MQSRSGQINRLLTSIMASMVVLSAMAAVEVRMPNQEEEVIVNQLRTDCTLLLSDREGQEALGRILRHPKGMVLMRAIKGLSQKHIGGEFTCHKSVVATLPKLLIPTQEKSLQFINIPIESALLAPATQSLLRVRAPSIVLA